MYRTYDAPTTSIYRVNVVTDVGYYVLNVKASSPSAACDWVLTYPASAGYQYRDFAEVTNAYKLRKQPVWLKKIGTRTARFDLRKATTWDKVARSNGF